MTDTTISAVKIPNFISSDPTLWFTMAESTFELASPKPITESKTKYNYCVATLPPDAAVLVRDIILDPNKTDPYQSLKDAVISRCGETKTQEIKRLLAGEQLGDRKPSELLRIMQRRAESHNVADSLLLELFLQQLPNTVQSILASVQPLTPQKAAEVADRIMEVSPAQVCSSSVSPSDESCDISSHSAIVEELKMLRKEVASLRRSRSQSRNRFRSRNFTPHSPMCWYHQKYQEKAKKCIEPCSFKKENTNGQV